MQEVERRVVAIDLNGKNIIEDCKGIISFLKEKFVEMKVAVLSEPFKDETGEIYFFKYRKPMLLGRLMFFYKG